ncbi:MAG: molybdenum cofactor guanylyltransferase [Rhodothermaceae bacterium]|nr:molybdenum cofactor guanylyltransferase [Rhodothermaceae bacterium]
MRSEVTGLILAGGQSRRFGTDKALAEVDGEPMIARVYAALAPLCTELLVSVDRPERTYPLPGSARFVVDTIPDAGPLAGLHGGLSAARAPAVLVLACDLPFLTTDTLTHLLNAVTEETEALVAEAEGRTQPLCAVYARRVLPTVERQLTDGTYAMHTLLDRLTVRTVTVPAKALHNVNTPADVPDSAQYL